MIQFFANVPIWVFPLFILLLYLGLRARKDRSVPIFLVAALPLLGILTVRNIIALEPPIWVWWVAAISYAIGINAGVILQRNWIIARTARVVEIKGEWITLTAMMVIFTAGFVNGFLSATMPALTQTAIFLTLFTFLTCAMSGQFMGRAIATLRAPIDAAH